MNTNSKDILPLIHLIRAALISGLLAKEEIVEWAETFINKDVQPDIFFIDLVLLNDKTNKEILHYINEYLDFEEPIVNGRPLLGLLWKRFSTKQISLKDAKSILFLLMFNVMFSEQEQRYIYEIDNGYDLAESGTLNTLEGIEEELLEFITIYKDYTLENYNYWQEFDKTVNIKLDALDKIKVERIEKIKLEQQKYNNK